MRGVAALGLVVGACALAVACSSAESSISVPPSSRPGTGVPGGSAGTGRPTQPPQSCRSTPAAACAHGSPGMCIPDWETAQAPTFGCRNVSTQSCAGFDIAFMPEGTKLFFDAQTGKLVAGAENTGGRYTCVGGPQSFTDPLILECTPPLRSACARDADAGDGGDGAADATTADATDGRATD